MVKAGKMMWNEIVNANWIRDSISGVISMAWPRLINSEDVPRRKGSSRQHPCFPLASAAAKLPIDNLIASAAGGLSFLIDLWTFAVPRAAPGRARTFSAGDGKAAVGEATDTSNGES